MGQEFDGGTPRDGGAFDLDAFTVGYVEACLWANTLNADVSDTVSDARYWMLDVDAIAAMQDACAEFQIENAEALAAAYATGYTADQAGCDFALTRNRHGAGFWDRGLGDAGKHLTDAAHAWGDFSLHCENDRITAL